MKLYKSKKKLTRAKASITPEYIIKMHLKRCFHDINTFTRKGYEIGSVLSKGFDFQFETIGETVDEIFEGCRRNLK